MRKIILTQTHTKTHRQTRLLTARRLHLRAVKNSKKIIKNYYFIGSQLIPPWVLLPIKKCGGWVAGSLYYNVGS